MQKKQKIFLASSQEQYDKRIVTTLKDLLKSAEREPLSWTDLFSPNEYTLDTIEWMAKNCDAAVFVFGADDLLLSRQDWSPSVRDNVVLEYGLFLGSLERRRVFILRESDVRVPSDLFGIERIDYHPRTTDLKKELEQCADKICRKLEELGPRDETSIDYFGIPEALRKYLESASLVRDFLAGRARNPKSPSRNPIHFDSYTAALEAYRQGLAQVEERFWTTSFLHSGFWVDEEVAFDLNRELLRKAKRHGKPVVMRRLLLIESDPRIDIKNFGKNVRMLYRSGRDSDIDELWGQLQRAKNRHLNLAADGCETRITRVDSRQRRFRIGQRYFDLNDEEMAIYDHFRVDFFGGGGSGQIADVKIFSPGIDGFDSGLRQASQIFEDLWEGGIPVADYFRDLQREYESSMCRVDHIKNWIFKYHNTLPRKDEDLKKREMEETLRFVEEFKNSRVIQNIGTCTGRYALELRNLVAPTYYRRRP